MKIFGCERRPARHGGCAPQVPPRKRVAAARAAALHRIAFTGWFLGGFILSVSAGAPTLAMEDQRGTLPPPPPDSVRLFPDYTGIVVPPNIAPLNFRVEHPGRRYRLVARSRHGDPVRITSRSPVIQFPLQAWRRLLAANAGEPLLWELALEEASGEWRTLPTVTNWIAPDPVDPTLVYRRLRPVYSLYGELGIYQRNLETFEERPVLENHRFHHGCLNCHTFLNQQPGVFVFHIRTFTNVHPMILVRSNEIVRVEKTMGYLSWHPSGRLLVFSRNKLGLFYHTRGETRDVFDAQSDLGVYWLDSNTFEHPRAIAAPDRNETWPAWSPDGRYLYFCSAPPRPSDEFRSVRYDLVRVAFDLETGRWGEPEVVLSSEVTRASAAQPRISPDGRWLLFSLAQYGNFPIYRRSTDLFLMDLQSGEVSRPDINSDSADSWHTWSSNSRWVVFSSKRLDGLFTRPFFTYVDHSGRCSKPFVLPQEDPSFYEGFLYNYNVPELVRGPVTVPERALARAILRPDRVLVPQPADAAAGASQASFADKPGERRVEQ